MNYRMLRNGAAAFMAAVLTMAAGTAAAQDYPNRAVRMIMPGSVGGQTDLIGRLIGDKLTKRWGQPVLILNRPGANGNIGAEFTAKEKPDGYTFLLHTAVMSVNIVLQPSASFSVLRDLDPIGQIANVPYVLVVNPNVPARTMQEFIQYVRANPAKLNYGAQSFLSQLVMEQINAAAGTKIQRIPYKAQADIQMDLISGRLDVYIGPLGTVNTFIDRGQLRGIATTGERAVSGYPDIRPIRNDLPNLSIPMWMGAFAPKGTPRDILEKINADLRWAMDLPDVRAALDKMGVEVKFAPAEELRRMIEADEAMTRSMVKAGLIGGN